MPPRGGLGRLRPTKICRDQGGACKANASLSRKEMNKLAHSANGNGPKKDDRERLDRANAVVDRGETRKNPEERKLKQQQEEQEEERKELLRKQELLEAQQAELDEQHKQQQLDLFQEKLQLEHDLDAHRSQQETNQQLLENQHQQQQLELHQTKHQMQLELESQQQHQQEKQLQQQQQLDHQVQQQQEKQLQQQQQLNYQVQQQKEKHLQQQQQLDHQVQQQQESQLQSQELLNRQQQELLQYKEDIRQKQQIIIAQQQQLEQKHQKEKAIESESLRRRRCQLEENHRQQQQEQLQIQQELQLQQANLEDKQQLLQQQFDDELEKGKLELLTLQKQLEKKSKEQAKGLRAKEEELQQRQRKLIEEHAKENDVGKQELLVLQRQLSEQNHQEKQHQQQRSEELKKQEEDLQIQRLQLQRQQEDEIEKGRKELSSLRTEMDMEIENQRTSLYQQQQQLQQQQQIFQEKEERMDHYYVHQPYATSSNAHYQPPQDPRFEELQEELRQERAEKGELRDLLRSLKKQLEEVTQQLNLQRTEAREMKEAAKRESTVMQERYLQELEAERAQVKGLNQLRSSEGHEDSGMEVDDATSQRTEGQGLTLLQEKVSGLDSERKKGVKTIVDCQLEEREWIRLRMFGDSGSLAPVQEKFEADARKEVAYTGRFELAPEYWPEKMILSEDEYAAGGRGVYLTTTTEVRKRMAGAKPEAWASLTLVTLFPPAKEAKEVQVVMKEKKDDGMKRILKRVWLSTMGREIFPKGTDVDATVKTSEMVVRIDKKWVDDKRWLEVKRAPLKITNELRKLPGYVDTYNARVNDLNVTVMLRVKATEVRGFLKESGKEGIFTKEKDHLGELAVKASVMWLPKDDTISVARDKVEEIEGGLGLVLNEHGLGIRVNCWHEKAARVKLHLPAKLPETRISGIPIGTPTDDAVKYLISREGWNVRKMKEGVRSGMRWMVVRGPVREGETVTIDGVLCLTESIGKKEAAKSVKATPKVREQKPEKRRDPSEGTGGKWYTRAEFVAFHGKKKGIRLWGEVELKTKATHSTVAPIQLAEQKQVKKEKNKPSKEEEQKKNSVDERLDRLERLLMTLVGSK